MSGDQSRDPEQTAPGTAETIEGAADVAESELLSVIDQLSGGSYFAVDANRNVIAFGEGMQELTGLDLDEVLGRHCLNAFRCVDCLKGCGLYQLGQVGPTNASLYHKDGRMVRVVKSGRVVRDKEGRVVMAVERVWRAADEVEVAAPPEGSAQLVFDRMMRVLGRYFVAADSQMRIVRCSQHLTELTRRTNDELRGLPLSQVLGQELFAEGSSFRRAVLAGERREGYRAFLEAADGERLPVSITGAPLPSSDDVARGCMADAAVLIVIRLDQSGAVRARENEVPSFAGMVARSPAMHDIFHLIGLLHDNDARVLITGESGTGKRLAARAIHQHSHRSAGPFVAISCASLPDQLLESDLFGHVAGAFGGATRDKVGRYELADGGTLFLSEVHELSASAQARLLEALQDGSFTRIGETKARRVDVRIIAATHVDLGAAVEAGEFREDLYYQLRVVPIDIPPLRERREDLEVLIDHLLDRIGRRRERALRLSPGAMRALLEFDWPGNVHQLETALEYATAVCQGQFINEEDLPDEVLHRGSAHQPGRNAAPASTAASPPPEEPLPAHLSDEEREEARAIRAALAAHHYRRQEAADELGISRWTLWRKMKAYGVD